MIKDLNFTHFWTIQTTNNHNAIPMRVWLDSISNPRMTTYTRSQHAGPHICLGRSNTLALLCSHAYHDYVYMQLGASLLCRVSHNEAIAARMAWLLLIQLLLKPHSEVTKSIKYPGNYIIWTWSVVLDTRMYLGVWNKKDPNSTKKVIGLTVQLIELVD